MAIKLSNVIGAPFEEFVLYQLYARAVHNSTTSRSDQEVLFLANKTAWARLVSSVDIAIPGVVFDPNATRSTITQSELQFYQDLGVGNPYGYPKPSSLASDWVLEAGTSKQNGKGITLRQGIGPDGAYGLGGTDELGYRPMPGLTSVQIETTGRLGSLRQATVSFKVWNMHQLNVIEALYFRLGYSMLLEWGHTQYYKNDQTFQSQDIYGIGDPFVENLRKEDVQIAVARKVRATNGNYDGMLGVVSNFNWSYNQDGGFDCTVKLVGLGSVMDSLRVNQSYTLPDGAVKEFKKNQSTIQAALAAIEKRLLKVIEDAIKRLPPTVTPPATDPTPKNKAELRQREEKYDDFSKTASDTDYLSKYGVYSARDVSGNQNYYDYYGKFQGIVEPAATVAAAQAKWGGLWLSRPSQGFIVIKPTNVVLLDLNVLKAYFGLTTKTLNDNTAYNKNGAAVQRKLIDIPNINNVNNPFVQRFDYTTGNYFISRGANFGAPPTIDFYSPALDDPLPAVPEATSFRDSAKIDVSGGATTQDFYFKASWTFGGATPNSAIDRNFVPTRRQFGDGFQVLIKSVETTGLPVTVTSIVYNKLLATVEGTFIFNMRVFYKSTKVNPTAAEILAEENSVLGTGTAIKDTATGKIYREIPVSVTFTTNNPGFILGLGVQPPPPNTASQNQGSGNTGNTGGQANQPSTDQVEATEGYQSALHAMLVVVKTETQAQEAGKKAKVVAHNIKNTTQLFYQDGALNGVFNATAPSYDPAKDPFNLTAYALKGYNSSLMMDPSLYSTIPTVSFDDLCYSYIVRYTQGGSGLEAAFSTVQAPVYIKLGYLLAFLNNMCLIYDATQLKTPIGPATGTEKRPYVYIDFNPDTNFCLTSPQQISTDPLTCLIPLNATQAEYDSIYPEGTNKKGFYILKENNPLTYALDQNKAEFKSQGAPYQGKLMNVLLNIDYLIGILGEYASADPEHSVNLQPFLERIMIDVNKALGNVNLFSVSYRDDSNTIQIVDNQWVPSLLGKVNQAGTPDKEKSMIVRDDYLEQVKNNPILSGQLPLSKVSGLNNLSIVRQFQFKTVMSTKLASTIAISAQAATGSVNAKDHSSLSWLNTNYQDRYKKYVQDPSNSSGGVNPNSTSQVNAKANDQKAADLFNAHVQSIYSSFLLSVDKIDLAKNYYIERMSKVKSKDPTTLAAPFIPADLEITVDGISGIIMGNAFTIPEDRLPSSLKGADGFAKVGFIVTGLTHTVESNQWLTRMKGQMIKLRENSGLGVVTGADKVDIPAGNASTAATDCTTSYPNLTIIPAPPVDTLTFADAAAYLRKNHPNLSLSTFALVFAEASKNRNRTAFVSAGGNNFGGVQTDSGKWGSKVFVSQFCKRDNSGTLRMFATFSTPYEFLDFTASRLKAKGFTDVPAEWVPSYINKWWSPAEKAQYIPGSQVYQEKLDIFKTAQAYYNKV